jgi:hypothetical protein
MNTEPNEQPTPAAPLDGEGKAELIAEAMRKIDPPASEPPEFVRLVMHQLEAMKVKPRCQSCAAIGWASFTLHHAPVITPTVVNGEVILSACFICLKCGAETRRNLNVLGLQVKQEQRRVLTPAELAGQQKQPLIVTS